MMPDKATGNFVSLPRSHLQQQTLQRYLASKEGSLPTPINKASKDDYQECIIISMEKYFIIIDLWIYLISISNKRIVWKGHYCSVTQGYSEHFQRSKCTQGLNHSCWLGLYSVCIESVPNMEPVLLYRGVHTSAVLHEWYPAGTVNFSVYRFHQMPYNALYSPTGMQ